jgi:hypothetical protein
MGGNRRNRGGHSSSSHPHHRTSDPSQSSAKPLVLSNSYYHQNDAILAEIEGGLSISWKDIGRFSLTLLLLNMLGIVLGIAAGMTISIHYFEKAAALGDSVAASSSAQAKRALTNSHAPRITSFDQTILGSNSLIQRKENTNKHHLDLGTVLTASASGQLNVLFVVDEADPLYGESPQPSDAGSDNSTAPNTNGDKSSPRRLSPEQANKLVPQYTEWLDSQPNIHIREPSINPITCKDGSLGFDEWNMLKAAVQEANSISAERFLKWSSYFANVGKQFVAFNDDLLYYEEDVVFQICPGATLRARRGPIFLNAENVVIECDDDCTIDVGGTHLAFGPHAKNVLVRGITFRGARSSSLTFFHDGADATFEDCSWIGNSGISGKYGAVADVNSTSSVKFHRCEIGHGKSRGWFGGAQSPGEASSLSIRT